MAAVGKSAANLPIILESEAIPRRQAVRPPAVHWRILRVWTMKSGENSGEIMARTYFFELPEWPRFYLELGSHCPTAFGNEAAARASTLEDEEHGFASQWTATLNVLTEETIKSSAIEAVVLDPECVRSQSRKNSGSRWRGLRSTRIATSSCIVEMMLDATQRSETPLTKERLFDWRAHLFSQVRTTTDKFRVGAWRDDSQGAMQVISGPNGRLKVHYVAPAANRLDAEMERYLVWFESNEQHDPLLKTAIAHLWFVTIHPFEDGNGRIARAIAEMCLARSDGSAQRFYTLSSQILKERKSYYEILEKTQSGSLDITEWLGWFLECLDRAFEHSNQITSSSLARESSGWI
jgi:Fic family protein